VSRTKRFLESRVARVLTGVLLRLYRAFHFSGTLFRHDPRLLSLLRSRRPAILACWHQDFLYTVGYLSRWNVRRRSYVLASASRDGGLAAAAAEAVGFRRAVRGSSARGGARALLALHRLAARGDASVAVVCDGPRPPARELKPGVLHLARETGLPVYLVRTSYHPARVLERTWARFLLPSPFARAVALADGPIHVASDLGREGLERLRRALERRLDDLAARADRLVATPAPGRRPGEPGPDPVGGSKS
jgi:lysophospholipid acyltransferase (LPLAT)-like uncharacterized protein